MRWSTLATRVQQLLAPDLEWWFHDPLMRHHLMHLLAGAESGAGSGFTVSPHSIKAFGSTIVSEGDNKACQLYWVHC
ncbi:hypothetical protein PR202_ga24497 [Eleusine coracana subsp. coracana]|uniref:Uncharacterized protein n=1 Tax=Eleusine coracana subsp. coracana TaxID=191504 RepID=A0AAV5D909_ELECO|nr:hypothetical protein PR202_ga24497 [Eleusine coracana subsp. coracana]